MTEQRKPRDPTNRWVTVLRDTGVLIDQKRWAADLQAVTAKLVAVGDQPRLIQLGQYGKDILDRAAASPDGRVRAIQWRRRDFGRWYAREPRLQQITHAMRGGIVAAAGFMFVDVDFHHCHLHIAAALSGDEVLAKHLRAPTHLHAIIGKLVAPSAETVLQRKIGKMANFALLNGGTWGTLKDHAEAAGILLTEAQARDIHTRWWATYPKTLAWTRGLGDVVTVRDGQSASGSTTHTARRARSMDDAEHARRRVALHLQSRESALLAWMMRQIVEAPIAAGRDPWKPLTWPVRPVLAMHDGFVLEVVADRVKSVLGQLPNVAAATCKQVGLPPIPLELASRRTWKAEPSLAV